MRPKMSEEWIKDGMQVEVTSNDDGFRGAWYVAKIIQAPMEKYVEVEYNELISEDDDSKKLSERVHVSFVRPLPPVGKGYNEVFEVNDAVDAFYNDGWWSGVVDQVVENAKKIMVRFDDPGETMAFKRSEVRLRFDWIDGNWEKPVKKQDSGRHYMLSNQSGKSRRQKRRANRQQPGKEKKDNTDDGTAQKKCTAEEVDMSVKESEDAVHTKSCETPPKKDQKNQRRDLKRHTVDSTHVSTNIDNGLKRKRGRPKSLFKDKIGEGSRIAKESAPKKVKRDSCVVDEAELIAKKDSLMLTTVDKPNEDHFQPLSNKPNANEKHTSGDSRHNVLCSETAIIPLLKDQEDETVLVKGLEQGKNSLPREHNEMSKIVDSGSQYQECDNASRGDSSLPEVYNSKEADMLIDGISAELNEDQVSNSRVQQAKLSPADSDNLRSLPVQRQCANANSMEDDFRTPIAKKDGMEPSPPQKTDGSRDLPVKTLSHADSTDNGGEIRTISVCAENEENSQSLPFPKCSPLWKYIESMEIFKKTTKKPHFSPLVKCEEEIREGLAIGHVVNFSNLVENMSKIQFRHPITVIERKLGILADLKAHGFDVETVEARLAQLLSKKQREGELQKEYQDIEQKILNSAEEMSKADEEIAKLKKEIRELQAKLDDTISRKEIKENVIPTLQSKRNVVRENLGRLQTDFENILGAPL
ncbi:DUF724 domain-containing protein 6 isoform X2 [Daucus carota subsp. sativus]|uniref:DUF724 domain-containing protein 6 isoform X2 n=1 Tax=Daucus carota subsp. sativus TaxID=79200 RepID=UPI0007F02275|nr:PREDICTED: DUF724 domain-containing protein 6-like isoform X2 [Daucus carota subsp. sativus]